MPRELGVPVYYKYSELKEGTRLVTKGEFVGVTEGKFGPQYNFMEIDSSRHVVLNKAGSLEWRIEQGHIKEGEVFDITYDGAETLTRGQFAGKEAHKFKIAKYEDTELPEKYWQPRNVPAKPAPEKSAAVEALDDLE